METLNNIEKITFLISVSIVIFINLLIFTSKLKNKISKEQIKRLSLIVLLFINVSLMKSQDTIYFKNKIILASKITEVGISEIKYKYFNNGDETVFSCSKNEIERIKYVNGTIDTITYISNIRNSLDFGVRDSVLQRTNLVLIGTEVYYNNKILSKLKTHQLLKNNVLSTNQINLIKEVKSLKKRERGYNALGTGLFLTGFAIPVVVTIGAISSSFDSGANNTIETIVAGAITGALFRITGHVVAKVSKNKGKARKLAFLNKHSKNEIIY